MVMISIDEINKLQAQNKGLIEQNRQLQQDISTLQAENERLKEEVETRDNLVEHFRKEAINWAKISNDCIKDIENYKQTLQEIKEIAEANQFDFAEGSVISYQFIKEIAKNFEKILKLTKAEEK